MDDMISVIVPVYKVEKYLDQCISSIVNQTFQNLEIILVDDGSPDRCPQMCDEWAKRDGRIRVIHKENGGLSDARNAGLRVAAGAFVAFVDSDDDVDLQYIEALYRALNDAQADIAECGVLLTDEDGQVLRERSCEEESVCLDRIEALRRLILEKGVYQTVWNKLYRRTVIEGIDFEVGKCHEDDFWTYQVLERVERMVVIKRTLYHYLQRASGIMGKGYSVKRLDGLEARYRRMQDLQKYPELADLARQNAVFECLYHWQCVLRQLCGEEKSHALDMIREKLDQIEPVKWQKLELNLKYKIWYRLFLCAPGLTASIRNRLGIGF